MKTRSRSVARVAAAVFPFVLAWIVMAANLGVGREFYGWWLESVPGSDLLGHFFLMGAFSFVVNYALSDRRVRVGGMRVPLGSAVVAGLVLAEEFSQIFLPRRSFSLADLAADAAGIVFFGWLAAKATASETGDAGARGVGPAA